MCGLSFDQGSYSTCNAVFFCVLGMSCSTRPQDITESGDYITRLNYGFAAVKVQTGCITSRVWTHTFHLTLPEVGYLTPPSGNDTDYSVCGGYCARLAAIKSSLKELTNSTTGLIRRAFARVKN
jgi:hypothetical protein